MATRNVTTAPTREVLTASAVKSRLAEAFATAQRPIAPQELNALVFIRQGITVNAELAEFIASIVDAVDCVLISGDASWITNRMLRGSARGGKGISFLCQPLTASMIDFMDRHAGWMSEASLPRPNIVAGYQRLINFHQADFGVGDNNTCDVCNAKRDQRIAQTEARVAQRQELLAKAAEMLSIRSDRSSL